MLSLLLPGPEKELSSSMSINHRRISLAVSANLFLELINKISPLLILHHAQKSLGLAGFGWAQYQLALFETLQPFITYGFPNFAMAQAKDNDPDAMRSLSTHIFALKSINALLVIGFFILQQGGQLDLLTAGILTLVVVSCVFDAFWLCVVRHKLVWVSLSSGILRLISLGLILFLVRQPEDQELFLMLSILPMALISLATGFYAYSTLAFSRISMARLRHILFQATPYALLIFLITLLDRLDIFLVEHWFGIESAGVYAGPARITLSVAMLLSALALPFFAETRRIEDRESLYQHVNLSVWLLSASIAPLLFGLPFVETTLIEVMFPRQPASAEGILSLLSFSLIGSIFLSVFGVQILLAKGKVWEPLKAVVAGLIIVPLLMMLLQQRGELFGVAFSMVIGKIAVGLLCLYLARDLLLKFPFASFFKPMLAAAGMGVALFFLGSEIFVVNVLAGALIYIALLVIGNYQELRALLARFRS
jgi:O-antigen/teichoic acid export membrane protein